MDQRTFNSDVKINGTLEVVGGITGGGGGAISSFAPALVVASTPTTINAIDGIVLKLGAGWASAYGSYTFTADTPANTVYMSFLIPAEWQGVDSLAASGYASFENVAATIATTYEISYGIDLPLNRFSIQLRGINGSANIVSGLIHYSLIFPTNHA